MSGPPHWYTAAFGEQVDLNDPKTYEAGWFKEHMALSAVELRAAVGAAVGGSLYYMICWSADTDWDKKSGATPGQYSRVVQFGKSFARESREPDRRENVPWLRKQLFLILDEIENQC